MTKRALTILIAAVLIAGGAAAVIASTLGGSSDASTTHVMPNGQTMSGDSMGSSQMRAHLRGAHRDPPGGQLSTGARGSTFNRP